MITNYILSNSENIFSVQHAATHSNYNLADNSNTTDVKSI